MRNSLKEESLKMATRDNINQMMNRLSNNLLKNGLLEYTQSLVKLLADEWEVPDEYLKNINLPALVQRATPKVVANKKRNNRKKAQPGAPSKSKTAYIIFSTEVRGELSTDENGDKVPFAEVGKLIGQKWKELDVKEKKVYLDLAEEDKQRYFREMKVFDPDFKEKEKTDPKDKQLRGIDEAKNRSTDDTVYCYNVSTGRQLKYSEKNKDKYWDNNLFLCGNSKAEVDACIKELGLEQPKKKKVSKK